MEREGELTFYCLRESWNLSLFKLKHFLITTFGSVNIDCRFSVFAGFIYDSTKNYSIPFYLGGAVEVIGGVLIVIAVILRRTSS